MSKRNEFELTAAIKGNKMFNYWYYERIAAGGLMIESNDNILLLIC